jgi:hypothetical protein
MVEKSDDVDWCIFYKSNNYSNLYSISAANAQTSQVEIWVSNHRQEGTIGSHKVH